WRSLTTAAASCTEPSTRIRKGPSGGASKRSESGAEVNEEVTRMAGQCSGTGSTKWPMESLITAAPPAQPTRASGNASGALPALRYSTVPCTFSCARRDALPAESAIRMTKYLKFIQQGLQGENNRKQAMAVATTFTGKNLLNDEHARSSLALIAREGRWSGDVCVRERGWNRPRGHEDRLLMQHGHRHGHHGLQRRHEYRTLWTGFPQLAAGSADGSGLRMVLRAAILDLAHAHHGMAACQAGHAQHRGHRRAHEEHEHGHHCEAMGAK